MTKPTHPRLRSRDGQVLYGQAKRIMQFAMKAVEDGACTKAVVLLELAAAAEQDWADRQGSKEIK